MPKRKLHWESLTAVIGKLVSSHPGKVVIVFLVITVAMWFPLRHIDISTKISDYLPECEYLAADEKLRDQFDAPLSIVAILTAESGNVLDRRGITVLQEIDQAIYSSVQLKPFLITEGEPVISIANPIVEIVTSKKKRTGLAATGASPFAKIGGLLGGTLDILTPRSYEFEEVPEQILQAVVTEILKFEEAAMLVSTGDTSERESAIIVINFKRNMIPRDDETAELLLLETMNKHVPKGYTLISAAARNQNMEDNAKASLTILLPISTVLLSLVLLLALRSFMDFFVSMAGLLITMIIAFGLFSLLHLQFSQLTFFAPIIIMVLAIDYAIHLLLRYKEYRKNGQEPSQAMSDGIRVMGVSIMFSTVTTALGFGANAVSKIPAVATFGLFLALGICVSFAVMLFFVPALKLLYLRVLGVVSGKGYSQVDLPRADNASQQHQSKAYGSFVSAVQRFLYSQCLTTIIIAVALCIGGLVLAQHINKDVSSGDICAADSPVILTERTINEKFPAIGEDKAYVLVEADLRRPEVIAAVKQSIANMLDDDHVAKVDGQPKVASIIEYLKNLPRSEQSMAKALTRLYEKGAGKEATPGEIQALLSKGDAGKPFDMTLLIVETQNTQGTAVGGLISELAQDLRPVEQTGEASVSYAGFVFERYKIITEMAKGMNSATAISIVLCALVAVVLFKSLRFGLITALPIVLVTGWILGTMYLLGFTLNVVTATITAMSVGIGIDYSLHLTETYRREKRQGKGITESMTTSILTTGPSVLAAGLTTICGFMVMALSNIGMIRSFGILASLVILFALLSSLIVLPAMLFTSERIADALRKRTK